MFEKLLCQHPSHKTDTRFVRLHRGGDDELYVISKTACRGCKKSWHNAVQLPEEITNVIDENLWAGTLEKRTK